MPENEIPEGLKEQSDKVYLALVEKYENSLDEDGNDPDYDFDEEYEHELTGYHCLCCGHIQETSGLNFDCDKCCAGAIEEIYE